jgi:hypothetical protein
MSTMQRIGAGLALVGVLCVLAGWLLHVEFVLGFGVGIGLVGAVASFVAKSRRGAGA